MTLVVSDAELDGFHGRGGSVNVKRRSKDGRDHHGNGVYRVNGKPAPRPFMAWDGEGITYVKGKAQSYVLFGCSAGEFVAAERLTSLECLQLIMRVEQMYPHVIHVGFSFKYDVEMILADMPKKNWYRLRRYGTVRWSGYRLTYHPGKRLTVSQWNKEKEQRTTATIYDVWGFFQSSFVTACRKWLDPNELTEIDRVEDGKAERGAFKFEDMQSYIIPYWRSELGLTVRLVNRLRHRLIQAGVVPTSWHGPGAIATGIYKEHKVREHMARTARDAISNTDIDIRRLPQEVNEAAQYAYSAGHFECFRIGHSDKPAFQYDINSAYPAAISRLPSLRKGEWIHDTSGAFDPRSFGMYHIEFDCWSSERLSYAMPLFYRDNRRCVSYPLTVSGWYWTPEAALVVGSKFARITESWTWHQHGRPHYPFLFVLDMYAQRQKWKEDANPAEKALKLALNSLYG